MTLDEMIKQVQALESMPDTPEQIIVPVEMGDAIVQFAAANYLHYKSLPWYRKLIYKYNMWRCKI